MALRGVRVERTWGCRKVGRVAMLILSGYASYRNRPQASVHDGNLQRGPYAAGGDDESEPSENVKFHLPTLFLVRQFLLAMLFLLPQQANPNDYCGGDGHYANDGVRHRQVYHPIVHYDGIRLCRPLGQGRRRPSLSAPSL